MEGFNVVGAIDIEELMPPYRVEFLTPHAPALGIVPCCCARHAFKVAADLLAVPDIQIKVREKLGLEIAESMNGNGWDFVLPDYVSAMNESEK